MKRILAITVSIVLLLTLAQTIGGLLMPVRRDYGATWEAYLQEPKNSIDTLFFGSSLVYCDIMPTVLEQTSGASAYVMAGPEQTVPITYYYVREACRTQSPKTVVVELTGMFYEEYQNFTKVNLGYMPWGLNRLRATFEAAEPEERMGLLLPLYQYHDRIYTVESEEISAHLLPEADALRGYTYLEKAEPQQELTERPFSAETETYRNNLSYLRKLGQYCRERGIRLVLYVAPSYARIPTEAMRTLQADVQTIAHTAFFDCNDGTWPQVDAQTGWYDSLHYNVHGAEIFSREMAKRLENIGN